MKDSNQTEYQNDWALDIKNNPIHIDHAESGAKGYYCMGCEKEMQAVKFKNSKHQSYFRHHATNIDKEKTECVVASKKYRERIAEQILHRLKEIKVPALYKYPPKGIDGAPMYLEESKTITAYKVKAQLTFYEDEEGKIKWGKNPEIDERHLLIRPDITFFDANEQPILFIEFVVTHKIPIEKKVRLSRLGINTVQIIIPKKPEDEIEKSLKSVKQVKWVYNEIEANTKYIPVTKGDSERIFSIDEEQRRLFEESYACTAAKIGNLVRTIKRCLGGQSYRNIEHLIEREISRIEEATKREEAELGALEKQFEKEVRKGIERDLKELESEETEFERRKEDFSKYREDLEKRYIIKTRELKEEERGIGQAIRECHEIGTTEGAVERKFKVEEARINEDFRLKIKGIERDIKNHRGVLKDIEARRNQLQFKFGEFQKRTEQNFTAAKRRLEEERGEIEKQIEGFGRFSEKKERELNNEFEELRKQTIKRIKQRDVRGNDELSRRIKAILEAGRLSSSFNEAYSTYERYRKGLELVRRRTKK